MAVQGHDPSALRVAAKAMRATAAVFAALAATYLAIAAATAICPPAAAGAMAKAKLYFGLSATFLSMASMAEMKADQQQAASLASGFTPPDVTIPNPVVPDTTNGNDQGFFGYDPFLDAGGRDGRGAGAGGDLLAGLGGSGLGNGAFGAGAGTGIDGFDPGAMPGDESTSGSAGGPARETDPLELATRAGVAGLVLAGVIGAGAAAAGVFGANRRSSQKDGEDEDEDEPKATDEPVPAAKQPDRTEA
jgi:hypothetical protein